MSVEAEPIAIDGERPIDVCKRLVRTPKVILDCGAGKGAFAALFRAFYPNARILSCEPTTRCFDLLKEFTERQMKIECRQHAVSDKSGRATINLTANDESSSFLASPDESNTLWEHHHTIGSEEVEVKTIDGWLAEEGIDPAEVSILKLDLQGMEPAALRGAWNLLKHVEVIVSEVWHQPGYEDCPMVGEVTELLKERGFIFVAMFSHPSGIWSDAIYRRVNGVRLNIGAGDTVITGFTAIDRKFGTEAYPLNYPDSSVEEIRCSHMLEHLSYQEAQDAFKEWNRVLKPGGRLRVSVPDVRKVAASIDTSEEWRFHLMGGQTDQNDFHKSAYDDGLLRAHFDKFGFDRVQNWLSPNTDSAAHPCSLNLEGYKKEQEVENLKIRGIMSIPRVGWNDAWHSINSALRPFGIPVETFNGVFWGQCMQRAFQNALTDGIDWLLCLDYDSMITAKHVDAMLGILGENPHIDALASLQARRGSEEAPLLTIAGERSVEVTGEPIKVATAHFGLTLIRTECLAEVAKPWFKSQPDSNGEWGDERFDDDIWFWHQWRKAGKNIYVAPDVRIGHLQLMVAEFDEDMQFRHVHVNEWRKANKQ